MPRWKLWLAKCIAAPCLALLGPVRVTGREQMPKSGGVLVIANHESSLDPILVQWASSRPISFMAEVELFEMPVVGNLVRAWHAFPVKQDSPDRGALRLAVQLLEAGQVVCIFPEGGLIESATLGEFKGGVALILRQWRGPVIPIGIRGSRRAMPYGSYFPRPAFSWIQLRWGQSKTPPEGGVQNLLSWMRQEIADLV